MWQTSPWTSNHRNSKQCTDLQPQAKKGVWRSTSKTTSPSTGDKGRWKGVLAAWNHDFSWAGSLDWTPLASSEHCNVSSISLHANTTASFHKGSLLGCPWLTEPVSRSPYILSFRAFWTLSHLCAFFQSTSYLQTVFTWYPFCDLTCLNNSTSCKGSLPQLFTPW